MPFDAPAKLEEGDRRLLVLADYLETEVKDVNFDLMNWMNECGTVGCAIGHACSIPEFIGLGLRFKHTLRGAHLPTFNGHDNWNAVGDFFGLSEQQSRHLFSIYRYYTLVNGCVRNDGSKKNVIARIRKFVAERIAEYATV